jgi:hypothetical protein
VGVCHAPGLGEGEAKREETRGDVYNCLIIEGPCPSHGQRGEVSVVDDVSVPRQVFPRRTS